MGYIVTAEQMKKAEQAALSRGIKPIVLMENAGAACYKRLSALFGGNLNGKTVTLLCGRGNNGGDGFVFADSLKRTGAETLVVFTAEMPDSEPAKSCWSYYGGNLTATLYNDNETAVKNAVANSEIVIDCVYGTGFRGKLPPKMSDLFAFINKESRAYRVAVDVPSGVECDTGARDENAFVADTTLMLGAVKRGLLSHPCFDYCGNLILLDIGLTDDMFGEYEAELIGSEILKQRPKRRKSAHKGSCGRLLNVAGSERYIGAALLSTKAAYYAGAGLVTLACPRQAAFAIASGIPEAVHIPLNADRLGFADNSTVEHIKSELQNATAAAVGCGLGTTDSARKITEYVVKNAVCPVIIDADGINSISGNINVLKENDKPKILTPHPAEFGRLTNTPVPQIQQNRISLARGFARDYNVTLVLKGVNTIVASPTGRVLVNTTGNAGLAKAGSGDVLTGIIASFAAQGADTFTAAALGVYMHGLAADKLLENRTIGGIMPNDVAEMIGQI